MPGLVSEAIEGYVEEHSTPPPAPLAELAAETRERLTSPGMLSGAVEGRLLETLVFTSGARRILEFGTYSGFSALSMAAALPPGGQIITCEIDPERAAFARGHIERSPDAGKIEIRVGPALETVAALDGQFDLVFIDADKESYASYLEASIPLLSERGLIVVDNTLWSGRVLEDDGDEPTRAIKEFNDSVRHDPRLVCVILTVRDGITLIRRAGDAA